MLLSERQKIELLQQLNDWQLILVNELDKTTQGNEKANRLYFDIRRGLNSIKALIKKA